MSNDIKKRLLAIEAKFLPQESYVIAVMPDGTEREVLVAEYVAHGDEWGFKRMGRGFDPTYKDIEKVLSVWDKAANNAGADE